MCDEYSHRNCLKKGIAIGVPCLFFATVWVFFQWVYPYHLFFKEQLTLFVMQRSYVLSYLAKPAFLTQALGDFITQFYILSGGGATVVVLTCLLLWVGIRSTFKRIGFRTPGVWALLPVLAECVLTCYIEYPLAMTLGAVVSVWTFVVLSSCRNLPARLGLMALALVLLYPLVGAPFFIFACLAVFYAYQTTKTFRAPLLLVVLGLGTPWAWGLLFHLTPYQAYFYPIVEGYMMRHHFLYLITEGTLVCLLLVSVWKQQWVRFTVGCILAAALVIVGATKTYQPKEELLLDLATNAYFNRWERVLEKSAANPHKLYMVSYYHNLALSREKRLPYELLNYYQPAYHGLLLQIDENVGYLPILFSTDALQLCGDMAQAQHSALLGITFTPHQRSSRMARKLAEIALINEDNLAADKYLWLLEHTLFHKKWARTVQQQRLEGKTTSLPFAFFTTPLRTEQDILFSPNQWYKSLRNLLQSNPQNQIAVDYLLCFHLLNKDLAAFKQDYDTYYWNIFGQTPPRLYQEALLMCLSEQEDPMTQMRQYGILPAVYEDCNRYLDLYQKAQGNGRPLEPNYGKTYWFYYYYAQIK